MPWKETKTMDERVRFAIALEQNLFTMTELCERFGISRPTGYKWKERYLAEGIEGLREQPRVPHRSPLKTSSVIENALVELRRKKPRWGPKKLVKRLSKLHPNWDLPGPTTGWRILRRHDLIVPRRRRSRPRHPGKPYVEMASPNDVWTADYKGQFRMKNGRYCFPLTVGDGCSRYLLGCRGRHNTRHSGARPVFERLFREYGLPLQILTDNGVPFVGSNALAGLSKLAVWWIQLGIHPIRIEPGCPNQNGRHERMHRTLKAETTRPPRANLVAQQESFDEFRQCYNEERPHESLDFKTPSEVYESSPRPYPDRLPPIEYPNHFEKRKVATNGCMKWHDRFVFVSRPLIGEYVGLDEVDDGVWSVFYGPVLLARFDERDRRLRP